MRPAILRHILSSSLPATFEAPTCCSDNIKNSYCLKKLFYTKIRKRLTAALFTLMVMAYFLTADARPLRHHSSAPSSSSAFRSSENSFEIDKDAFRFTTRVPVLRRRSGTSTNATTEISVSETSLMSESTLLSTTTSITPLDDKNGHHSFRYNLAEDESSTSYQRSSSSADISSLNIERRNQYNDAKTTSTFRDRARDAFLRLDSKPFVESTLLPEEERRQIWLERHRQRKLERKKYPSSKKDGELLGQKRLLTLTNADLINSNHTCAGDLFKHKVRMAGCEPNIIINRFCHGSCASFFIPKLRSKKLKATFQSCAACVPIETDLTQVRLDCPDREEKVIYRTVMRVKRCACRNIELDDDEDDEV